MPAVVPFLLSTYTTFIKPFAKMLRRLFLLRTLVHLSSCAQAQDPYLLKVSPQYYGPDGPWQAVEVTIGYSQPVALYPGGAFASKILSTSICDSFHTIQCGLGGLFDPYNLTDAQNSTIQVGGFTDSPEIDWTKAMRYNGSSRAVMADITLRGSGLSFQDVLVPDVSSILIEQVQMIYPDGTSYPVQVGQLALGSPSINQSFSNESAPPVNASLIPGWLVGQKIISSNSYGLHIGAAAFHLPLSLWLGGYDQSRVIGPISSQPCDNSDLKIDLLDIGIDVDHGASPSPNFMRQGLLSEGNSSISGSLSMQLIPAAPYIYLPQSTCDAIAKNLPVTFQKKYGLYFWNVQDSRYQQIVSSPSYLGFSFRSSSGTDGSGMLTVKVPFRLLNLTLDVPLIDTPTAYFPCQPPQNNGSTAYVLGRAFLQAAFIGVNWDQGSGGQWYLAQAPGPNTTSSPAPLKFPGSIKNSSAAWADTWSGFWTPIARTVSDVANSSTIQPTSSTASSQTASTHPTSSTNSNNTSLKTASKAGIGVGIVCGAIILALVGTFMYRRQLRTNQTPASSPQQEGPVDERPFSQQPLATQVKISALCEANGYNPAELYTDGRPAHEVSAEHHES